MNDSLVPVRHLELNVSYGCNLKCEYCSHLGRYLKGTVPLRELVRWYVGWNRKIEPGVVRIMGGEPLLHPELEIVLMETRTHWPRATIELVTNGLLLRKRSHRFYALLRKIGAVVKVSRHFDGPHYDALYHGVLTLLDKAEVPTISVPSVTNWVKYYRLNEQGEPVPCQSDPGRAWQNCYVPNLCTTLLDNCLYQCPQIACAAYGRRMGYLPKEWEIVSGYRPLSPDCTRAELEAFMNGDGCDQCGICPESFDHADRYEKMNPFGLPMVTKPMTGEGDG